jgi:predicted dehydrogenase
MVKVGIIGAGYIGRIHAYIIQKEIESAAVTAVTDSVADKGKGLAYELGADFYPDVRSMLKSDGFDTVAVCTPTLSHSEYVILAAQEKKHIFCEKPLAMSIPDADRMIEAVHKNGVKAMSGHVLRFWPVYVKVKETLENGELGIPVHGFCERLLTIPDWPEGGWHIKQNCDAGAALDVQIHDLDYLAWIFGKPVKVRSEGIYKPAYGGWMHIITHIVFESGQFGHAQAGWGFPRSYPFTMTIRILCHEGAAEWNFKAGKLLETRGQIPPLTIYKKDGTQKIEDVSPEDPFILQWKYFIECIEQDRKITRATFGDGRNALNLALSSIESAKTNREVTITNW